MLIGVTTCLNYSKYLKETLHNNIKYFDKFYVITSEKDTDTIDLCKGIEKVSLIKTEVFFDKNAPFYKSKALNLVLDTLSKEEDIWCAIIDADVLLPETFKQVDLKSLDKNCIYSYKRDTGVSIAYEGYIIGYFQLFNTQSIYYNFNYDLMFRTAAGSDLIFSMQWPLKNNIFFVQDVIKHISLPGINWCGVDSYENNINTFIHEIKSIVNINFKRDIDKKTLIHKYVILLQKRKSILFLQEKLGLERFIAKTENIKYRLTKLKNLKTKLLPNNESIKEDINKFIDEHKILLCKLQTEINTHNTRVQELYELLKSIDC